MRINQIFLFTLTLAFLATPGFAKDSDTKHKPPGSEQEMQHDMSEMDHSEMGHDMNSAEHEKMMKEKRKHKDGNKAKSDQHKHSGEHEDNHAH